MANISSTIHENAPHFPERWKFSNSNLAQKLADAAHQQTKSLWGPVHPDVACLFSGISCARWEGRANSARTFFLWFWNRSIVLMNNFTLSSGVSSRGTYSNRDRNQTKLPFVVRLGRSVFIIYNCGLCRRICVCVCFRIIIVLFIWPCVPHDWIGIPNILGIQTDS